MEKDDEYHGSEGTSYDFGARQYDSRIGRWLSRDALEFKYPSISAYSFSVNSPLYFKDFDGNDFKPTTVDGITQAAPMSAHDLGQTKLGDFNLVKNDKGKWDLTAEVNVIYNFTLFNKKTESYSPGLAEWVCSHETGHTNQIFEAISKSIEIKVEINGQIQTYNGRADEVMEKVENDIVSSVNKSLQSKLKKGIIKTQEEYNVELEKAQKKVDNVVFDARKQALEKVEKNIITDMDTSTPEKKRAIENDANARAAEYDGAVSPYASGEAPVVVEYGSGYLTLEFDD